MTKTLLTILAHPDDESFGMGGTLAKYGQEGVAVHIAIATDGAAGSVAEGYEEAREQLAAVRAVELDKAVAELGATLHRLGYRDSGMPNDPANQHPDAWINADDYEAIGRVVRLIRETKPDVVVTHDETGGYYHPDHIQCWKIVTPAFTAAADPEQYPEMGEPHQAQRLYYSAVAKSFFKWRIAIVRLRGEDPTQVGRNKDIDLTRLGHPSEKIHTLINIRQYWDAKIAASQHHASQGGGTTFLRYMPLWLFKILFGRESYMRAYPPVPDGYQETDFFA